MSIAEYKKKQNKTKIVDLEYFKVKIRQIKVKDYLGVKSIPSIYSLAEGNEEVESVKDSEQDIFALVKALVCSCVLGDEENDMPFIVDKPANQCSAYEISFGDTLTSEDAFTIFNVLNDFSSEGGLAEKDLATFSQESEHDKANNEHVPGVQQATP